MESFLGFIGEVYTGKPDSRLTVKEIYEDFRVWIIEKYDITTWNRISQRQVYAALKQLPEYPYVRFKEGYCLKGITRREKENPKEEIVPEVEKVQYLTLNILQVAPTTDDSIKVINICPRIQGVILPTLGRKTINK